MALFAHLSAFFGGIIVSGIIWGVSDGKPFTRRHAAEAFNFGLTYLVVAAGLAVVFVASFALVAAAPAVGVVLLILVGLAFAANVIGHFVFAVMGALAASRREEYRYPVCIRFVKP